MPGSTFSPAKFRQSERNLFRRNKKRRMYFSRFFGAAPDRAHGTCNCYNAMVVGCKYDKRTLWSAIQPS
jgi:hypothetical protein